MSDIWSLYPQISVINRTRSTIALTPTWTFDKGDPVTEYLSSPPQSMYCISGSNAQQPYPYTTAPSIDHNASNLTKFVLGFGSNDEFEFPLDVNYEGWGNNGSNAISIVIVFGELPYAPYNSYSSHPHDAAIWYLCPAGTVYKYVQGGDNDALGVSTFNLSSGANCVYYVGLSVADIDTTNIYTLASGVITASFPDPTNATFVFSDDDMSNWLDSVDVSPL